MAIKRHCFLTLGSALVAAALGCDENAGYESRQFQAHLVREVVIPASIYSGEINAADELDESEIVFVSGEGSVFSLLNWSGHARTIGRKGSGPCELGGVSTVLTVRPGVFLSVDAGNRRIQEWSANGRCRHETLHTSLFLSQAWLTKFGPLIRVQRESRSSILLMLRSDSGGQLKQQLELPIASDGVSSTCVYCYMAVARDGSVYSYVFNDTHYRVLRFAPRGAPRPVLERANVPLIQFAQSEKDSITEFRRWLIEQEPTAMLRAILAKASLEVPIPEVKRRFRFTPIVFERLGLLLLTRSSAFGSSVPVDLFDLASGKFMGEIALPVGSRVLRANDRGLLVVGENSTGEPIFSQYQLTQH